MTDDLDPKEKALYLKLIEHDKYNKLGLYFNKEDTESVIDGLVYHSREKYPKAWNFFSLGKTFKQRLMSAGNGTGKTETAMYEIACHLTGIYPEDWPGFKFNKPNHWWICGKSKDDVSQIIEPRLVGPLDARGTGMVPKKNLVTETMTQAKRKQTKITTFQVKHISGGMSTVEFKSYDQGAGSFRGAERNIWLDEEPPYDVYTEALARIRMGGMLIMTFTPTDGMTDTIKNFTNGGDTTEGDKGGSRYLIRISIYEVPHLDQKAEEERLMSYPAHERLARSMGEPSIGRGAVYPIVVENVIQPLFNDDGTPFLKLDNKYVYCMAIDFGWIHPTACLWAAYDKQTGVYYIIDEYKKSQEPPEYHAQEINLRDAMLKHFVYKICDPSKGAIDPKSGRHTAEMYQDYEITFEDANNDVDTGLFRVLNNFNWGSLKIMANCTQTIEELRTYQYDKKGKIKKINDDLMDCLRYLLAEDVENFTNINKRPPNVDDVARKVLKAQKSNRMFNT